MTDEVLTNDLEASAPESKESRIGRFEIYQDVDLRWRFRYFTSNGNSLVVSSEPYERRVGAAKAVEMLKLCKDAKVEFLD